MADNLGSYSSVAEDETDSRKGKRKGKPKSKSESLKPADQSSLEGRIKRRLDMVNNKKGKYY